MLPTVAVTARDSFEWGICANIERISSISANDAVCILIWQSNNAVTRRRTRRSKRAHSATVTQRERIPLQPTEWRSSALFRGPIISNIYTRLPLLYSTLMPFYIRDAASQCERKGECGKVSLSFILRLAPLTDGTSLVPIPSVSWFVLD